MLQQSTLCRARRSLALVVAMLLSGCLEPLAITTIAQSSARKGETAGAVKADGAKIGTVPSVTSSVIYTDKGPLVRIALLTDVNSVALRSEGDLAVRRSPQEKPVVIAGDLTAEIRQPAAAASTTVASAAPDPSAAYRVEVSVVKEAQKAKKIAQNVKSKYDQTASTIFDGKSGDYRIVTGKFSTWNQANDMAALLRGAGYARARPVPVQATAGKTRPMEYRTQPSAKESIVKESTVKESIVKESTGGGRLSRGPQIAAFAAENLIASGDKVLIITPVESPAAKVEKTVSPQAAKPAVAKPAVARTTIKKTTKRAVKPAAKPKPAIAPARSDYYKQGRYSAISEAPRTVIVGKNSYRGEIHLTLNERGRLNVVNVLALEEYLRGVVPLELSPSIARLEALKAQAVAARSYAIASLGRFRDEGFDLRDDQRSQVYGGFASEQAASNRAVEETRGVVALTFNEAGKAVPIEALYSANCGGRTENSENIFLTRSIPYLRSVECALEGEFTTGREIVSSSIPEPLREPFGPALARDLALLSVLGFSLPARIGNDYLKDSVERGDLQQWAERVSVLRRDKVVKAIHARNEVDGFDILHEMAVLKSQKRDITRLPGFAALVALAAYGEHRESQYLSAAEVNYLLAGLGTDDLPPESRADVALLMRDGILRLPGEERVNGKTAIRRGHALETMARALSLQAADLHLQTATAVSGDATTLVINGTSGTNETRGTGGAAPVPRRQLSEPVTLAVEPNARLFRLLGKDSYAVDRVGIRGSERITYHLNTAGRIDFLEVEAASRNDSRDVMAGESRWNESLSGDEVRQRLLRARLDVGDVLDVKPTGFGASRRVVEVEIAGSEKTIQLRGQQIRTVFGLKDNPLVIERDLRGQAAAFTFTGTGHGHGVGLCQIGAERLARQGLSYISILQKYYTGVSVQKIY